LVDVARFEPDAIVASPVSMRPSTIRSPLLVTHAGFSAVGRQIADLDRATVIVHEGGYVLRTLAGLTLLVLESFQS
jgi:acetoin utilization deacetylase AcuC-like enzyme